MIVLISPAKTMKKNAPFVAQGNKKLSKAVNQNKLGDEKLSKAVDNDELSVVSMANISCEYPIFIEQSKQILDVMKQLSSEEIQKLMKVNEKIASETQKNFQSMIFDDQGMPALYTYDGIQYKAMDTHSFSKEEMEFANEHIRILSGLYGMLRPNTSIYPYRLEMQLKQPIGEKKNLYEHWKEPLAAHFSEQEEQIKLAEFEPKTYINLASKEYSKAVEEYLNQTDRFVTCTFKVVKNGVPKIESTASKQARGAMVQTIVRNRWTNPEQLKQFDWNGYRFDVEASSATEYVFIKE